MQQSELSQQRQALEEQRERSVQERQVGAGEWWGSAVAGTGRRGRASALDGRNWPAPMGCPVWHGAHMAGYVPHPTT